MPYFQRSITLNFIYIMCIFIFVILVHGAIWVGARTKPNSRNFQWKDGTNVSQYWNHEEPNNNKEATGIDEECVEASYYINGVLNDKECSKLLSFVCQGNSISFTLKGPFHRYWFVWKFNKMLKIDKCKNGTKKLQYK